MCLVSELLGVRLWKCGSIADGSAESPILSSLTAPCAPAPVTHPAQISTPTCMQDSTAANFFNRDIAHPFAGMGAYPVMTEIQRSIEILEALVGFDTTSHKSNLPLVGWIESYLDRHGVAHERIADRTGTKANVWATIGPADKPGYILSGHTDVVPVDGQSWSSDPFRLAQRDGRLFGRGATDMKGFLACCLAAVPDMVARPLARPLHLAISYDEEVGCVGVRDMIAQ